MARQLTLDEMRQRLVGLREATEDAYKMYQEKARAGWHGQPLAGFLRYAKSVERKAERLAQEIAELEGDSES